MKHVLAAAAVAAATLVPARADSSDIRTVFSFVANVSGEAWTYNDVLTEDAWVTLPLESPWRCIRRKVYVSPDGEQTGTFQCSSDGGRTDVFVSATCGPDPESSHSTADLSSPASQVTLRANCITVDYGRRWVGF